MTDRISVRRSFYRAGSQAFQGTCTVCSAPFLTGYEATLYCSDACRQRAHRQRQAQQSAELPVRRRRRQSTLAVEQQLALPTTPQPAGLVAMGDIETRVWQGTPIQRRASDGWVNATAMCQAGGREWFTYARSSRSQEYIAALAGSLGSPQNCGHPSSGSPQNPATVVIQSITTGPNEHRGTWIHPRLAVDLARWISPAFAVWMDGWFLESIQYAAEPPAPAASTTALERFSDRIIIRAASHDEASALWHRAVAQYVQLALIPGRRWRAEIGFWSLSR